MQRYKVLMELRDKGTFPKDFDKEGDGDYSQVFFSMKVFSSDKIDQKYHQ